MKAREYVANYWKEVGDDKDSMEAQKEATVTLLVALAKEIFTLTEQRNCQKDAACFAIARELQQKWNAIYPQIPHGDKDMLRMTFEKLLPDLYALLPEEIWTAK